jgi:hypothetical protein
VVPELLVVAASVVVEIGVSALILRTVLEAGFLFAALYVFTPTVFPAVVGGRRGAPGFRILVALVTLLFALPSLLALTTFETLTVSYAVLGWYLLGAGLVSTTAFACYFRLTQSGPLSDPGGDAFAILRSRTGESVAEQREYVRHLDATAPRLGTLVRSLSVVAAMATYVGPCLLFGVAAAVLESLFPLLETFVIVGLLFQAGSRAGVVDRSVPDVETRFYDRLTAATRSVRGTAGVLIIVVGIVFAAFLVLLWIQLGLGLSALTNALERVALRFGPEPGGASPFRALISLVAAVGGVVALPLASGYAVWYWFREFRRFTVLESADPAPERNVARPPGLLVAATALTVSWFVRLTAYRFAWPVDPLFAVAWPLLALALLRNVRRARVDEPEPPNKSAWTIPAAYVIYGGGVTLSLAVFLEMRSTIVLAIVLPVWIFYLDGLSDRATDLRGRLRVIAYEVALVVGVFAFRGPLEISSLTLWVVAGGVALLILGHVVSQLFEPPPDEQPGSN